jgi:hypothetical protein
VQHQLPNYFNAQKLALVYSGAPDNCREQGLSLAISI